MESYQKRKRLLEETYGKPNVNSYNDEISEKSNNGKHVKQITDITDEEGLKNTYQAKDGLYQH